MRSSPGTRRPLLAALLGALLAVPVLAQEPGDGSFASGSHFGAFGNEFVANQTTSFTQYQPKVALRPDGKQFVVVWASTAGADVYARVFDAFGAPLTGQIQCDTTFTAGTQDEPSVAMDASGRFLVAWTDRHGNDGSNMGVYARLFNAAGQPQGPDFRVNVTWQASQWEPFVTARPGGGWVVGWTGTDGGATYMRLYDANAAAQTGEIEVAQFNSKQLDPVPAVARDGTMFFAWIDFNGKGGPGNGTSVFGRYFNSSGVPLGPEFQVNTTNPGEQREARTAADSIGRFLVVWEDHQADGNGTDIHARRYSALGFALSPEWQVNTTQAGNQVQPEAAYDWVGNSIVVWEDQSAATPEIRAQRYNPQGQPLGLEFVVNQNPAGEQELPDVAVDWAGENFVFSYAYLNTTVDAYARRFRFRPLTQTAVAIAGGTFGLELDFPGSANLYRVVLMAFGTTPGIPLPDGRTLNLAFDPLFTFVLSTPNGGGAFTGFVGPMPADATALASVSLPGNPVLVGLTLQIAALTLDLGQTGLGNQLRHVTGTLPVTVH